MFSDNDELATLLAQLMKADKLILMTDIDGLYDGNPEKKESKVIDKVEPKEDLDKYIEEGNKEEGTEETTESEGKETSSEGKETSSEAKPEEVKEKA